MADANIASVQAQIDNNPVIQQYLHRPAGSRFQRGDPRGNLPNLLAQQGIQIPHDYVLGVLDGKLYEKNFWNRNPWVGPAIVGGVATMGVLSAAGVFGGGALPSTVLPQAMSTLPAAGGTTAASGAAGGAAATGAAAATTATGGTLASTILPQGMSTLPATSPIFTEGIPTAAEWAATGNGAGTEFTGPLLENARGPATSSILNRNNFDRGAGIIEGSIDAYQRSQRDNRDAEFDQQQLQLQRDYFALNAPNTRVNTSRNASILKNWTPVTDDWGGPGSAARGQQSSWSGGYNNPNLIDPRTRELADDVIGDSLQAQLGNHDSGDVDPITGQPRRRRS